VPTSTVTTAVNPLESSIPEIAPGQQIEVNGEPVKVIAVEETVAEPEPPPEPPSPEKLTRKQIGQLRRQYFTKVHGTVRNCGHKAKFEKNKPPSNNCVHCWAAYFATSVDLDLIHAILTQKGGKALVAMYGTKFTKMFHGFLSSQLLPALAAEINGDKAALTEGEAPATVVGGVFGTNEGAVEGQGAEIPSIGGAQ
jgi:hypothetical protein